MRVALNTRSLREPGITLTTVEACELKERKVGSLLWDRVSAESFSNPGRCLPVNVMCAEKCNEAKQPDQLRVTS